MNSIITNLKNKEIILDSGEIIESNMFVVLKYGLEHGSELTEEQISEICYDVQMEKMSKLLSVSMKTEKEIRDKMQSAGTDRKTIGRVIKRLTELRLIDDHRYIREYIYSKKYGIIRVIDELLKKGIGEEAVKRIYEEDGIDEKEFIMDEISKSKDKNSKKLIGALVRKGFACDDVLQAVGVENEY